MMMEISFNLYSALLARGGGQHNRRDYRCGCNRSLHRCDCILCGFAHQFSAGDSFYPVFSALELLFFEKREIHS